MKNGILAAASNTSNVHDAILIAVIVGIPLAVLLMWKGGEGIVPALGGIGTAFFMDWVVPRVPGSPIACLNLPQTHGNPCATQMNWVWVLNIGTPLGVAFLLAELRDRRIRRRRKQQQ